MEAITAQCCIRGGGPAGMLLGLLLTGADVDVVVLEKHADFFVRLFSQRNDSFLNPGVMSELGQLAEFLTLRHREVHEISGQVGESVLPLADFA